MFTTCPMSDLLTEVRAVRLPPPAARRAIRIASGATQVMIARELGVTRFSVLRYENGSRRPSRRVAKRYAKVLAALRAEVMRDAV